MNVGPSRRQMLAASAAAVTLPLFSKTVLGDEPVEKRRPNPIAVSTYSYWRYRKDSKLGIEECIDLAADAGFDGVEVLHVQMQDQSNGAMQRIKQRAFRAGLDLCTFPSSH